MLQSSASPVSVVDTLETQDRASSRMPPTCLFPEDNLNDTCTKTVDSSKLPGYLSPEDVIRKAAFCGQTLMNIEDHLEFLKQQNVSQANIFEIAYYEQYYAEIVAALMQKNTNTLANEMELKVLEKTAQKDGVGRLKHFFLNSFCMA